mgnify:CR=1 FL=1
MDDDLRELRREVATHPQDPARLRALAAALERAGQRRGAFLAWCDLSRLGDAAAQARVLGWSPWPEGGGLGRAGRARRAGITSRDPRLLWEEVPFRGDWLALASDEAAVRAGIAGLAGGGPWPGAAAWVSQEPEPPGFPLPDPLLRGDDLVSCDGQRLYLLDARRGTLLSEAPLELGLRPQVAARGDRLVVLGRGEDDPLAACLDLGAPGHSGQPGRVVWRTDAPASAEDARPLGALRPCRLPRARDAVDVVIGGTWAWLALDGDAEGPRERLAEQVVALRVETGVPYALPGLAGPPLDPQRRVGYELLGADEAGVVVLVHPGQPDDSLVYLVDARSGALRWARPLRDHLLRRWGAGGGALGPREVVLAGFELEGQALRVDVLERADGALRWSRRFPLAGPWPPHEHAVALADDLLYFAWTAPLPTIVAWEPADGGERFRVELPVEVAAPARFTLIPRAGELLFELAGGLGCLRGRLSD